MNAKLLNEVRYVSKGVAIYDVIIIIGFILTSNFNGTMIKSLIFGSLIALINFRLLALTIEKAVEMPANKAQLYSGTRYILRMFMIGVVLIVSAKTPSLNIIGVAIGLLGPKFVVLAKKLIINKLKRKEA